MSHTSQMPRALALTMAVAAAFATASVHAQQTMPPATGATTTFAIKGFELTGDIPLPASDTTRVLAPFIRADGTLDTLQKAGAALEAELKAKGYALHRVTLPPQEVGDKVTLNLVKFVIGKVTVSGNSSYSQANVRASVPELKEGEAPNFRVLAVQTAIANENPGKQVQVSLKESEEAEKIDAKLLLKESREMNLSASWANTGTAATGNDRLSVVANHANVFGRDHQASLAYTTSLETADRVQQFGLNYRIPLYVAGGVVGLSYTTSDVVGNFGTFNSTGAGQTMGANYSHYLEPNGGRRSYATVGLEERLFSASKINGVVQAGQTERVSRPISLGYTARVESDTSMWGYNAQIDMNVPTGSSSSLTAYQTEDARISTERWSSLKGGFNYLSALGKGWLWSARGQWQYSPTALISGEQFGLGGASSVRGAAERAIAGDSGVLGTLEVSTPELSAGLRLVGFADAGWLSNNNASASTAGKPATDQLGSAGLGLRYNAQHVSLTAEWARIVMGPAITSVTGPTSAKSGDDKLHVNLTARF